MFALSYADSLFASHCVARATKNQPWRKWTNPSDQFSIRQCSGMHWRRSLSCSIKGVVVGVVWIPCNCDVAWRWALSTCLAVYNSVFTGQVGTSIILNLETKTAPFSFNRVFFCEIVVNFWHFFMNQFKNFRFPDRRLPWILTTLSDEVLRLGGNKTEGIFRWDARSSHSAEGDKINCWWGCSDWFNAVVETLTNCFWSTGFQRKQIIILTKCSRDVVEWIYL